MKLLILFLAILAPFAHGADFVLETNVMVESDQAKTTACVGFERKVLRTLKRKLNRASWKAFRKAKIGAILDDDWTEYSNSEGEENGSRRLKNAKQLGKCIEKNKRDVFGLWLCNKKYGRRRRHLRTDGRTNQEHRMLEESVCHTVQAEFPSVVKDLVALLKTFSHNRFFNLPMAEKCSECAAAFETAKIEITCDLVPCKDC